MFNARNRSGWAALSSIAMLATAAPAAAQALDAATIARYQARLADNEAGRFSGLSAAPLTGGQAVPVLDDVVTWDRLRRDSFKGSFSDYAAFLAGHLDWPAVTTIRRLAERNINDDTPPDQIVRHFAKVPPLTAEGKWRLAEALAATGQASAAATWARDAWDSAGLDETQEARLLARFGDRLRPADHANRMDRLLWADRTTPAGRMLARVDTDTRLWALARIALKRNAPDVAARLGVISPALRREAGLLLDEAQWLIRNNRADEGNALLAANATSRVAGGEFTLGLESWLKSRLDIGRALWRAGNATSARAVLASHGLDPARMANRPVSERAAFLDTEWLAGWLALRKLGQPGLALSHFRNARAVAQAPISQARGDYWAGRAAEAAGQRDQARQYYAAAASHPDYFYGQLAAERLGQALALTARPLPAVDSRSAGNFRAEPRVRAVFALADVDRPRQTIFLKQLADTADTPDRAILVANLAGPLGRPDAGVHAGKAARGTAELTMIAAAFPLLPLPDSLVPRFAIIHAITRQESQFDRSARSSANALGMMQLLPGTAAETAQKLGLPASPASRLLDDPVWNVTLGSAYLERLRAAYGGSAPLAVAAYNAGPGNVRRFLALNGNPKDGDIIDWIESIPFSETRNYVQRVLENAVVYETLYPDRATTKGPNRLSEWLGKSTPG
ncbi:lytic transglycosylase domain-containing protein [Sandarakinorhabdus oryzae]|uniref:lytic transglycosylase domain-containing protein n=1 Tax=Sandarakinorhabdus oryzae TaxID=2675220 RepID=UPI0012E0E2D2|nr:lytic transglycosylase domain-containing protein [Sandarakinorhabdus oryzae]